jgi:hypothetical protein
MPQPRDLLGAVSHQGRSLAVGLPRSAAQVNQTGDIEVDYTFNVEDTLSQDSDFDTGLQPGDITKYSALPWQADFNSAPSTSTTSPTRTGTCSIGQRQRHPAQAEPEGVGDVVVAHRPLQCV